MAAGDISAVSISADGWSAYVTIEGWAGKQGSITYDFGDVNNDAGNMAFTVTSEGYTNGVLGTRTRTVYATAPIRQPYPNDALLDEVDSGADIVIRVALSQEVYDDDKNGGAGTSGVDPVVTVAAGWANDGANDNNAASGLTVTNNSTLDYPEVVGQWDQINTAGGGVFRRVTGDFNSGFLARHGFGIDKVTISAVGATSANSVSSDVTAQTATLCSASSLYFESYLAAIPISGYTQGERINLRAQCYPLIGDADSILDTNNVDGDANKKQRIKGNTTVHCYCDKTGAMTVYGIVDPTGGDNGTGVTSATESTARANPYATIAGAISGGANLIYVKNNGSPSILGGTPSNLGLDYYIEVAEDPTDPGVSLNRNTNYSYANSFLMYRDIGISYTSGNGWLDGFESGRQLAFLNCVMSQSSAPTVGLGYKSVGCYFLNCAGMGADDYNSFSTTTIAYSFWGCIAAASMGIDPWYAVVACRVEQFNAGFGQKASSNGAPFQDNLIVENNKIVGYVSGGGNAFKIDGVTGLSFTGNILESKSIVTSGALVWIGGDNSTSAIRNVILAHNTVAGERCNLFYNDVGTSAVLRSHIFAYGNAFRSINIKSDTFASSPNGNRVGNWAQIYSCNWHDNVYDGAASSSFLPEYLGVRTQVVGGVTTYGELGYVDEASSDGTGLGNGDYTPDTGSPLLKTVVPDFISFDLYGMAANDQVGAVFIASSTPSSVSNNSIGISIGISI